MRFRKYYKNRSKRFWMRELKIRIALYLLRKEVNEMAVIYATLIIKGKRTIESVPTVIRQQVMDILADLEVPELTK